ncbi:hypothetical protein AAFF_G00439730 [Aldrovandia affinis]|uniref:Uncharacterized protein n=1 Tax=Aldrovandia affinis TaxID=143900 RepID=A0AAD7WIM5_9TELE|nr:hypothetical protein AAFF_G00439730 [Aldrovandia affinis]
MALRRAFDWMGCFMYAMEVLCLNENCNWDLVLVDPLAFTFTNRGRRHTSYPNFGAPPAVLNHSQCSYKSQIFRQGHMLGLYSPTAGLSSRLPFHYIRY